MIMEGTIFSILGVVLRGSNLALNIATIYFWYTLKDHHSIDKEKFFSVKLEVILIGKK